MSSAAAWRRYRQHRRLGSDLAACTARLRVARTAEPDANRWPYIDGEIHRCATIGDELELDADRWGMTAIRREHCERAQPFGTPHEARDLDVDTSPIDPVRARRCSAENRPAEPPTLTGPRTHAPPTRCTTTPRTFGVHST